MPAETLWLSVGDHHVRDGETQPDYLAGVDLGSRRDTEIAKVSPNSSSEEGVLSPVLAGGVCNGLGTRRSPAVSLRFIRESMLRGMRVDLEKTPQMLAISAEHPSSN